LIFEFAINSFLKVGDGRRESEIITELTAELEQNPIALLAPTASDQFCCKARRQSGVLSSSLSSSPIDHILFVTVCGRMQCGYGSLLIGVDLLGPNELSFQGQTR